MNELFARRFVELDKAHPAFSYRNAGMAGTYCNAGQWEGWASSVEQLIRAVFGEASPHYANFKRAAAACSGKETEVRSMISLFRACKEDFEGGYVFNVELRVSGEVFGDFVSLARQSLSEGQKDVAAVLACAALEDAIKRLASANGLSTDGKTMADLVNALKAAGVVTGAQKSLLEAMPRIRNFAMHADWSKISEPDVSSVLGYVEQLLLTKFSGA